MHIARLCMCEKFSLTNKAYCKITGVFNIFWFIEPKHVAMDDEY